MKRVVKIALIGMLIGFVGLVVSVSVSSYSFVEAFTGKTTVIEESETYDPNEVDRILVDVDLARVNVQATDEDQILVEYRGELTSHNMERMDVDINNTDRQLQIGFEYRQPSLSLFLNQSVEIDVHLPQETFEEVTVDSSAGRSIISDVSANEVNLRSSAGRVDLQNIDSNKTFVTTSAGRVEVDQIKGDLNINTSAGKIIAKLDRLEQDVTLEATAGEVELLVQEEPTNMNLDFQASAGKGSVLVPLEYEVNSSNVIKGTVGDGDHYVRVRTTAGSFTFDVR
ncbi:DUF4097 family beta strand repeat-containing protein [Alkalibacillus aidingensis]|uniref:DUF4097 family beta strand repeat-containing protein n=1 Tax=Alkalibacillus aidingensis TaxID=2747607 RepID=UPI0016605B29|nr:DUF4097 family beta strand repeat-containing protein [Alkalibacillus aidingensis]